MYIKMFTHVNSRIYIDIIMLMVSQHYKVETIFAAWEVKKQNHTVLIGKQSAMHGKYKSKRRQKSNLYCIPILKNKVQHWHLPRPIIKCVFFCFLNFDLSRFCAQLTYQNVQNCGHGGFFDCIIS